MVIKSSDLGIEAVLSLDEFSSDDEPASVFILILSFKLM